MRGRRGFTLVELLTVIGIIALLIGLLLPSMVSARQASKLLACQSNLRQIHQASVARSLEHGGYVQIAGSVNLPGGLTPATLGDASEKRYAYFDDGSVRRPAPMQAALAPYLGQKNVRLDSAANLTADLSHGIVEKVFTCPAQGEPEQAQMISNISAGWFGPLLPCSYGYNEGLMGFEETPHRLRGNLARARPASQIIFLTDAVTRRDGPNPFIAWFPFAHGRCTLRDVYFYIAGCGMRSQFDLARHPRDRMNVLFCDGHVDTLHINERDLEHGVMLAE
jgi:prepilin-type N-terminal cleavage/methylation domain-containing protein/prepilin-type processing-associated H-X9-DG protein